MPTNIRPYVPVTIAGPETARLFIEREVGLAYVLHAGFLSKADCVRALIGDGATYGLLAAVRMPDRQFSGLPDDYADRCLLLATARAMVEEALREHWKMNGWTT